MAKCLYFRQSMSSNQGGGGLGAPSPPGPNNSDNNKNMGLSNPTPTSSSSRPSSAAATSLVNSSDLSSLCIGDDLPPASEGIFGGMELDLQLAQQAHRQQQQDMSSMLSSSTGQNNGSSSSNRVQQQQQQLRTTNSSDSELNNQVPITSSASMLSDWNPYAETPSLAEAILETEFLRSIGIHDNNGANTTPSPTGATPTSSAANTPSINTIGFLPKMETEHASDSGRRGTSNSFSPGSTFPQASLVRGPSGNRSSPGALSPAEMISPKQSPVEIPPSPIHGSLEQEMDTGGLLDSLLAAAPPVSAGLVRSLTQQGSFSSLRFPPSDMSSNASSQSDGSSSGMPGKKHQLRPARNLGSFRSIGAGSSLEPIPEDEITEAPTIYQPLVPPALPKPATSSYNISFPTTLQPRDRFDFWRSLNGGNGSQSNTPFSLSRQNSERGSAATSVSSIGGGTSLPHSPNGGNSQQSPYHATSAAAAGVAMGVASMGVSATPTGMASSNAAANWDVKDLQPMNILDSDDMGVTTTPTGKGAKSKSGSKRVRKSTANLVVPEGEEDQYDGASVRKGRKSSLVNTLASTSAENKRRDSIKTGLEDLQRMLPHVGKPEEERISQASVLFEAGKYIRKAKAEDEKISSEIDSVRKEIEELNNQIESFQNELPVNGAPLLPKAMATKTLADQFHDHVVRRTLDNWKYWVFVNITGHLVHSFDQTVKAAHAPELEDTTGEWMSNHLSLQNLRKDAYRKLAKLCAKTSIVETPSKLPEEALGFVSRGERGYSLKHAKREREPRQDPHQHHLQQQILKQQQHEEMLLQEQQQQQNVQQEMTQTQQHGRNVQQNQNL